LPHYLKEELDDLIKVNPDVFKFIQSYSSDGLWYWDLENPKEEYLDHRFWEVLGIDPSTKEHSPKEWQDLMDPEHLEIVKTNVAKHLNDPDYPYDQIVKYRHSTGRDVWVRCFGVAIRNEEGKPTRMLGCHTDITELKQSEINSREMLNSYRALLDTESLYYIKTDVLGNYSYANDCFLQRFGLELEDILGTSSLDSIIPEDHPKTYKTVQACFKQPDTPHPVVLRKPYGDGRIRSNHWEFYGMTDQDGQVKEIICVGVEITDLVDRILEIQKLLDAEADKNYRLQQHSYITSHNIRNSVANMLGLFEMIREDPEDRDTYVDMLETSVKALDGTISNLTKLLTEEKEANYSKLTEINIKENLERIINLETGEIANIKANVNLHCDKSLTVKTLPTFFDSVFHNLISNALKYGTNDLKNSIDINVRLENEQLSIEVRDYGEGFNLPNNAELLFRIGTRLDTEKRGQGLGLFITKHHARMIGASIEVNSKVGEGTSFKVVWENE